MIRGLYTAGTGMLAQRDVMDVLTNNLVNADTTGYKADSLTLRSFEQMIVERLNDPFGTGISNTVGNLGNGAHIDSVSTSFEQGNLEQTGRSFDVALEGQGFFTVSTPDGDRYTRNGNFAISSDGYLINSDGYYIQGTNGKVFVGDDTFVVDEMGNVYVDDILTDRLNIVSFTDITSLRKDGDNLFQTSEAAITDTETKVLQGYLEGSNVDISGELVKMLSASRAYETNQRVLRMVDGTLDKTVNEVGRV